MPATYVEENCTIEHEGRTYESGGAFVSDTNLVAYPAAGGVLTTWHGTPIGTWRAVSSWRVDSYMGTRMYAIRATVDGATYHGRGFGEGCILRGKRIAAELREDTR